MDARMAALCRHRLSAKLFQPDTHHAYLLAVHVIDAGGGTLLGHFPSPVPGIRCPGQVALCGANGGGRTPVIGRIVPRRSLLEKALGFAAVAAMKSFKERAIHDERIRHFGAGTGSLVRLVQPRKRAL